MIGEKISSAVFLIKPKTAEIALKTNLIIFIKTLETVKWTAKKPTSIPNRT